MVDMMEEVVDEPEQEGYKAESLLDICASPGQLFAI